MLGKTAVGPMSFSQRQRQEAFYGSSGHKSEYPLFHTSRVIKYVFLDGSQNVAPSAHPSSSFDPPVAFLEATKGSHWPLILPDHNLASSYWCPDLERLPIFVTLSKSQQKAGRGPRARPLFSSDRLPVFRQLCGEASTAWPTSRGDREALKVARDDPERSEEGGMLDAREQLEGEVVEEKHNRSGSPKPTMISSKEERSLVERLPTSQ